MSLNSWLLKRECSFWRVFCSAKLCKAMRWSVLQSKVALLSRFSFAKSSPNMWPTEPAGSQTRCRHCKSCCKSLKVCCCSMGSRESDQWMVSVALVKFWCLSEDEVLPCTLGNQYIPMSPSRLLHNSTGSKSFGFISCY